MTTIEEDACEAVCQEMGMTAGDVEHFEDRALVWDFCERFLTELAHAGFRIRLNNEVRK